MTETEVLERLAFFKNAIVDLKNKLSESKAKSDELSQEIILLSRANEELNDQWEEANEKYEDLKRKTYLTIKHLVEDNIEKKEIYIENLLTDINVLTEERDNLKAEDEKNTSLIEGFMNSNKDLQDEVTKLKEQLLGKTTSASDLQVENSSLSKQLFDQREANLKLQNDNAALHTSFETMKKEFDIIKVEYEKMMKRGNVQDSINKQNKIKEESKKVVIKPVIRTDFPIDQGWRDLQFAEIKCEYDGQYSNFYGINSIKDISKDWVHKALVNINNKWYCGSADGYKKEYSNLAARILSKTIVTMRDESGLKSVKPVLEVQGEHVISNFGPDMVCKVIERCVGGENDN